ncbi:MAG: hypothetical protein LKE27_08810 [Atopobiaceae bacterium]|nr:hypothetical protein [Atopobiaceae bacterium]
MRNRAAHTERLFNPAEAELSSLSAVSAALKLLGGLCPEAARRLYGDDGMTPIELFCEGHPAPAAERL